MLINSVRTALALKLQALKLDRRAVTAVEYALIAGLIAVVIIAGVMRSALVSTAIFGNVVASSVNFSWWRRGRPWAATAVFRLRPLGVATSGGFVLVPMRARSVGTQAWRRPAR